MNYTKVILITIITSFFSYIFAISNLFEINHSKPVVNFTKSTEKPKLIFAWDSKNERKIAYPNKVIYSVLNYVDIGLKRVLGMPLSYELLSNNRYLIYRNFYPDGGSGSMENSYLIDLKDPRIWHLSSVEVVGGNTTEYSVSQDKKNIVFYDSHFDANFVFMDLTNEKTPYVSNIFTVAEFEKSLKEKLTRKFDLQTVKVKLNNATFEIISNVYLSDLKGEGYEKYKLIFDLKTKKLLSFSPFLEKEPNWKKLHTNKLEFEYKKEKILTKNGKFAQINFYENSTISNTRTYFFQLLRMSDYKVVYEYIITKPFSNNSEDSHAYLDWIDNNTAILKSYDENEKRELIIIDDSGNKVNIIKNYGINSHSNIALSENLKFIIESEGTYLKILRVNDKKSVFYSKLFNSENSATLFKWVTNDKVLFFDNLGNLHLIKINQNNNSVQDLILSNVPKLAKKDCSNENILSNIVNSNICFISDNNLYYFNFKSLEMKKLSDLSYSTNNIQTTLPYITLDGKKVFYMLVSYENNYEGKLMSIELKK